MRSDRGQLDIFDNDPRRLAKANREAADEASRMHQFRPSVREDRVQFYLAEAARYDALAAQCGKKGATP